MNSFKWLFFAILLVTLLVNLVFLFATKDKPPDLAHETTNPIVQSDQPRSASPGERRLVQRSNDEANYPIDDSAQPNSIDPDDTNQIDKSNLVLDKMMIVKKRDKIQGSRYTSESVFETEKEPPSNVQGQSRDVENDRRAYQDTSKITKNTSSSNKPNLFIAQPTTLDADEQSRFLKQGSQVKRPFSVPTKLASSMTNYPISQENVAEKQVQDLNQIADRMSASNKVPEFGAQMERRHEDVRNGVRVEVPAPSSRLRSPLKQPSGPEIRYRVSKTVSSRTEIKPSSEPEKLVIYSPFANDDNDGSSDNNNNNDNNINNNSSGIIVRGQTLAYPGGWLVGRPSRIKNANSGGEQRWLDIRVKSSRNHVLVSVDEIVIYESKSGLREQSKQQLDASQQAARYLTRSNVFSNKPPNANNYDGRIEDPEPEAGRGIHVIALNQFNGNVMSKRIYDTYSYNQDKELSLFLNMIQDGRILILAVKDEASFNMGPESSARKLLAKLGSREIMNLRWRDMWACILRKQTTSELEARFAHSSGPPSSGQNKPVNLAEALSKSARFSEWGPAVKLEARVQLIDGPDPQMSKCRSNWKRAAKNNNNNNDTRGVSAAFADGDDELRRRSEFCAKVEGYGRVCDCFFPSPIKFESRKIYESQMDQVPIIVIAGNRPYYLQRMLRSLLSADGIRSEMITVFIDGFYEEPSLVAELFNLRAVQHRPQGRRGARISHHYKSSLTKTFELYPSAEFVIIFEEDLDVAQDALLYFNQTIEILRKDESLYCVSAWNDQGYLHTASDPKQLYRIETMPGLGWMLKRDLYKLELEPRWPASERTHDWDMWIRMDAIRKGRECIIPDVSRTYHFGSTGTNINAHFQSLYFSKHAFNMKPLNPNGSDSFSGLEFVSTAEKYELHMETLIESGTIISLPANKTTSNSDATDYLCSLAKTETLESNESFADIRTNNIIYIKMIDKNDYKNWLKLANCWKIWDLDARGQHKSTWRLFLARIPTIVVGHPASEYSRLKPADVDPFELA